jgi:D-arabinitol 2-dehydrogenase
MLMFDRTKKILDDNPELQKQWTSLIPVGKMGRPEDLMGAVTFLSSDASLYVTVRSSFS